MSGSPSSPYNEVGISGQNVTRQAKRKIVVIPDLFSDSGHNFGHRFGTTKKKRIDSRNELCDRCGDPRFVVEAMQCKGKRRRG